MNPEINMHRCLDLASQGIPEVFPNPAVGCVVLHNNSIIGEGFHQQYGGPHAEVNALNSVEDESILSESILYVNLEPCNHYGKTPPCTGLIISKGIKKVVIACLDPSEKVNGKGVQMLQNAGIEVVIGILEKEALWLNRRFITFTQKKRPYIILKWAQTEDGFIADSKNGSKWISNEISRTLVHKWRAEEMAIWVGAKTALIDNPSLTTRLWPGKNPVRIVIDRNLVIPREYHLYNNDSESVFYNQNKNEKKGYNSFVKIDFKANILKQIFQHLVQRNIQSVIVEGGAITLQHFISQNYWDEARVFIAPKRFGQGILAPRIQGKLIDEQSIKTDHLKVWVNEKDEKL